MTHDIFPDFFVKLLPETLLHLLQLPIRNVFIRGSVLRYVHLTKADVDVEALSKASLDAASEVRANQSELAMEALIKEKKKSAH